MGYHELNFLFGYLCVLGLTAIVRLVLFVYVCMSYEQARSILYGQEYMVAAADMVQCQMSKPTTYRQYNYVCGGMQNLFYFTDLKVYDAAKVIVYSYIVVIYGQSLSNYAFFGT